jgi:NADH-quinone oxidoreductase subunit J
VAVFQVTVYVGAIAVLILFTVMLVRQESWAKEVAPTSWTKIIGALSGLAIAGAVIVAALSTNFSSDTTLQNTAGFLQIGQLISTGYAPILEVLALVLAASVIGALTLARRDKETPEE